MRERIGYSRRSSVETWMMRMKGLNDKLSAKTDKARNAQISLRINVLNEIINDTPKQRKYQEITVS